jgi:hypothetical protein
LFESVDEFDGGGEPDTLAAMLNGLDADRDGEMRLPYAGAADEDDARAERGKRWLQTQRRIGMLSVKSSILSYGTNKISVLPVNLA